MITDNKNRHGNFTSSQIYRLLGAPKPRKTYIAECNMERNLGRSLRSEVTSRATSWGKFVERRVFNLLDINYTLCSDITLNHETIDCWAGSPDGFTDSCVIDIKCPQLKSFCELVSIKDQFQLKEEYPEYYWQLISNSILTKRNKAELIVYAPYQNELEEIRKMCEDVDSDQLKEVYWINNSSDNELPYLLNDGFYSNLNILSFDIDPKEQEFLIEKILEYSKELTEFM